MAIQLTQIESTASGSDGSATGSGRSPKVVEGVVLAVNLRLIYKVAFTGGSEKPRAGSDFPGEEGDTLTGATSTETAIVWKVVKTSGQWADGDAAGTLWLTDQSGTLQSEDLDNTTSGSDDVMTIGGDSTAPLATLDTSIDEANVWPAVNVLTKANLAADAWFRPVALLQKAADGSDLTIYDQIRTADHLALTLLNANDDDSILATVRWDDLRRV